MKRGDFIGQATAVVVENAANEQFGVSELAAALHMSRSNLLRKIRSATNVSTSQFIRRVRLEIAMDLLKESSHSVSEISYQVGFGSVSYFIKCFREQYGISPGEVGNVEPAGEEPVPAKRKRKPSPWMILPIVGVLGIAAVLWFRDRPGPTEPDRPLEKSIAVLPFKNESSDSTNLYFVNGLMESTLNNLQKIKDLRVISRSSVEAYRNTDKTIPQIAEELHVSYIIEGSGQKVGDQVLLNIQLIDAAGDRHLWAEQYNRKIVDIFALQNEVAANITASIEAIVTPDELAQIEKKPTENLRAYDYYLQALDPFVTRSNEGLNTAIGLFEKAIEEDPEFSLAYANVAISCYLLDMFQTGKQYTEKINRYADKALLYDSKSAESLIAKAFYYIEIREYALALPHLQKALTYNPNSSLAVQMLADFYFRLAPDSDKYLEYALKGDRLEVATDDSATRSYTLVQLSNALISAGFVEEALHYVDQSLAYDADNYYAPHLKAFIRFARDGNIGRTRNLLLREWHRDTTRLDILQDIGKLYYLEEKTDSAYFYFRKFVKVRSENDLAIYLQENAKIAWVYERMGLHAEAEALFRAFAAYCDADQSMYRSANLAVKYAYEGNLDEALVQLRLFSELDHSTYWFLLLQDEPLLAPLKSRPEFARITRRIHDRFWENQARLKKRLEGEGLL
ncbi:MAG: helix-turn-helix domain-containing protein [Bacteroidales bacterium]